MKICHETSFFYGNQPSQKISDVSERKMSKFYRGVSTRSSLKLKKTKLNKKKRHPKSREIETPKEPEPMPVKEQEKLPEKEPEKIPEKEPERLPVEKSMTIKTEEDVKQEKPIRRVSIGHYYSLQSFGDSLLQWVHTFLQPEEAKTRAET